MGDYLTLVCLACFMTIIEELMHVQVLLSTITVGIPLIQHHSSAVVGLRGWLPCSARVYEAARRAASLPIFLCHGKGIDNFISYANIKDLLAFTVFFIENVLKLYASTSKLLWHEELMQHPFH